MSTQTFQINSQLAADSHELLQWQQLHIRLHNNACVPWVIIIPETDVTEFCDLDTDTQSRITSLGKVLGDYFKNQHGAEKINFAAIGNVVQQLHIHVIGRHAKDPLWPDVVWGNPLPNKTYSEANISQWRKAVCQLLQVVE